MTASYISVLRSYQTGKQRNRLNQAWVRSTTHHDTTVSTEFLAALDALARDEQHDPPRPALLAAGSGIVGLVGVELICPERPPVPTAPDRRDDIERSRRKLPHLVPEFQIFVVQPRLSRARPITSQLELLAVTEAYLQETFGIAMTVYASS